MAYGWFNPIKGSYPSHAQEDKTLQIDSGVTGEARALICRGRILALKSNGDEAPTWTLPSAGATAGILYFALQNIDDRQAEFAGATWYDAGQIPVGDRDGVNPKVIPIKNGPAISGIAATMSGEYETSEFDAADTSIGAGTALKVDANGKLVKATSAEDNIVGYATAAAYKRWCNDAPVAGNPNRTGANVKVLRFKTGA